MLEENEMTKNDVMLVVSILINNGRLDVYEHMGMGTWDKDPTPYIYTDPTGQEWSVELCMNTKSNGDYEGFQGYGEVKKVVHRTNQELLHDLQAGAFALRAQNFKTQDLLDEMQETLDRCERLFNERN